jgi:hypothetical protein
MTHITLTVSVRKSEVESLKKVCAMNDVTLFIHENAFQEIVSVTFETLSPEAVFYMARTLDTLIESENTRNEIKAIEARHQARKTNEQSAA